MNADPSIRKVKYDGALAVNFLQTLQTRLETPAFAFKQS
jgi:hypothetical protein